MPQSPTLAAQAAPDEPGRLDERARSDLAPTAVGHSNPLLGMGAAKTSLASVSGLSTPLSGKAVTDLLSMTTSNQGSRHNLSIFGPLLHSKSAESSYG